MRRSTDSHLKQLWNCVRMLDNRMQSFFERPNYCSPVYDSIFEKDAGVDEVVLCLNYDGLYVIKGMNRFLQEGQAGKYVFERYKVGIQSYFLKTAVSASLVYSLKGRILDIREGDDRIKFTIKVNKTLNGVDVEGCFLKLES